MYTNEQIEHAGRRRRRMHSPEFKAELVLSCQQAGVSVAAIAMEHGIYPILLRRWIIEHERLGHHEAASSYLCKRDVAAQFIPLRLPKPEVEQPSAQVCDDVVIDLQRDGLRASVRWPVADAQRCAAWLREVMR